MNDMLTLMRQCPLLQHCSYHNLVKVDGERTLLTKSEIKELNILRKSNTHTNPGIKGDLVQLDRVVHPSPQFHFVEECQINLALDTDTDPGFV